MVNVNYNSGIELYDACLSEIPVAGRIFWAIDSDRLRETAMHSKGQPVIQSTDIEVAPFIDMDNNMSYAVTSYIGLETGRMKLRDYEVSQRWIEVAGKNILKLYAEDGSEILKDFGGLTIPLARIADYYRYVHSAGNIQAE